MSKSIKKSVKSIAHTLQSVIENLEGHENGLANLVEAIDDLGNELSRVQERITDLEGGEPFTMNQAVFTRVEEEKVPDYCKADVEATENLYKTNPPVFPRVVPDLVVDNSSSVIGAVLSEISGRLSSLEKRLDSLDGPVVDLNSAEEDSEPTAYRIQMPEHTILVAFTVYGQTREAAHGNLLESLPGLSELRRKGLNDVTSWWVAEDDRLDGSDCDSAVFVHPGAQARASLALADLELSGENNVVSRRITNPAFKGKQI